VGQGSLVRIVTHYKLDGLGIKSLRGKIFCTSPDPVGSGSLLGGGGGGGGGGGVKQVGHGIDHPLHLVPRLKKEWICTSTSTLGLHGLF